MLSFVLASLVLMAVPGPDMALIMRNALVHGRRAGFFTTLGGLAGVSVHATASVVGLSALLAASASAFAVVKLVGAAYLAYLGVRALWHARGPRGAAEQHAAEESPPAWQAFRQGWLSNALNPKAAVFFVTFLPQFLPSDGPALGPSLVLMGLFGLVYLTWFTVFLAVLERVAGWLRRPSVQLAVERVTGACLLAFGARLAVAR